MNKAEVLEAFLLELRDGFARGAHVRSGLTDDQRTMLDALTESWWLQRPSSTLTLPARLGWTPERVATVGAELAALGLLHPPKANA